VAENLFAAEVILHAGDVCVASVLEELSAYASVHAVFGNNDGPDVSAWGASETAELDLAGLRVGMIHNAGPREVGWRDFAAGLPGIDLVVFGHSHIPLQSTVIRIFNPGSPTDKRRQPHRTSVSSRSSTVTSPAPRLSHCPDRGRRKERFGH
jgi:uncharacterized protein